jgi:hypothetical protein
MSNIWKFVKSTKKSLKIPKGGNQNPYIEEEQTTQWSKEKIQKDKQRSTKHTYKTKYRVTRTPLKTGGELRCSGRVSSSCSTSGTRRVNLVTNPVIRIDLFAYSRFGSKIIRFYTFFIGVIPEQWKGQRKRAQFSYNL